MNYIFALVVSGICWFGVASVLGSGVPILGEMWLQHLISAVITSLVVGIIFRKPLMTWQDRCRYILPFLTILSATTLFGLLLPLSWWVTAKIAGTGNVDGEAFYLVPAWVVFSSMTTYLLILYPLALLTQNLLCKLFRHAEQGAHSS